MLNKSSPAPALPPLAELLLADIRAGVLAEGERIPLVRRLAAGHGSGRPTGLWPGNPPPISGPREKRIGE